MRYCSTVWGTFTNYSLKMPIKQLNFQVLLLTDIVAKPMANQSQMAGVPYHAAEEVILPAWLKQVAPVQLRTGYKGENAGSRGKAPMERKVVRILHLHI